MPFTIEELRAKAQESMAHGWTGPSEPFGVDPADVLPHLDSEDRNVRVAALRVLAWCDGNDAAEGILRGLDDPKRRVRDVAAKSSARFLGDPRVVARLRRAIEEDDRASAGAAMEVLGGNVHMPYGLTSIEPVVGALRSLVDHPRYRQRVLASLLRARTLNDDTRALLGEFVQTGSKDEAVAATRRLDGFRVFHDAELTDEQRRDAEKAHGRVWYWVRVS